MEDEEDFEDCQKQETKKETAFDITEDEIAKLGMLLWS
jgi:hypothetical protein